MNVKGHESKYDGRSRCRRKEAQTVGLLGARLFGLTGFLAFREGRLESPKVGCRPRSTIVQVARKQGKGEESSRMSWEKFGKGASCK
jgi:hypothetical protein